MKKILTILLLVFLISCSQKSDKNLEEISIFSEKKNTVIFVEVVDQKQDMAKGLMYREKLEENNGMLFIFPQEQNLSFWMKNTYIPLDMIFISKDFKIVDVKSAVPCHADPCLLYRPQKQAQYVVEVNRGFAEMHGIGANDTVDLSPILLDKQQN